VSRAPAPPEPAPVVWPGGASYDPAATETAPSALCAHEQPSWLRAAGDLGPIVLLDVPSEPAASDPAEQPALIADSPPVRQRRGPPYQTRVAGMTNAELAGEASKHERTIRKHSGAHWLADVRAKLRTVRAEQERRQVAACDAPDERELTMAVDTRDAEATPRALTSPRALGLHPTSEGCSQPAGWCATAYRGPTGDTTPGSEAARLVAAYQAIKARVLASSAS
jgi:hypothetical protein